MGTEHGYCEDCNAFRERRRERYPGDALAYLLTVGALLIGLLVGVTMRVQGDVWIAAGSSFVPLGWITWLLGCIFLIAAVVAFLGVVYDFTRDNVIGCVAYLIHMRDATFHQHLTEPTGDDPNRLIVVRGRVGGWFRRTEMLKGATEGRQHIRLKTWDGKNVTVVMKGRSFTVGAPEALLFCRHASPLEQVIVRSDAYWDMLIELEVLLRLTDYSDPLDLGRSEHAKLVNERVGTALRALLPDEDRHLASSVARRIASDVESGRRRRA